MSLPLVADRVDVAGRAVSVRQSGDIGPTVILESGLGDGLAIWEQVQDALSADFRVIAYDRAGIGDSDLVQVPRTPGRIAAELHDLLDAIDGKPPYILVAHSAGGFHMRSFAALFPDDVAGLVLVEASHERLDLELQKSFPKRWAGDREKIDAFYATRPAGVQAEWSAIRSLVDDGKLPFADGLPDVPIVVLTATRSSSDAEWLAQTPEGVQVWRSLHHAWTEPLSNAVCVDTDEAGHYLHLEVPGLVVAAIREVLRVVQQGGRLSVAAITAWEVSDGD